MGKRKHGTASSSMTFATRHIEKLRAMKVAGENVSAFIDSAIEHFDETFAPHLRNKDPWEVKERVFRKNLAAVKRYVIENNHIVPGPMRHNAWKHQLQRWLSLEEEE